MMESWPIRSLIHPLVADSSQLSTKRKRRAPKLIAAATTWFSVSDEVKRPTAKKQAPTMNTPAKPEAITAQGREVLSAIKRKFKRPGTSMAANNVKLANHFPNRMSKSEKGQVNKI